MKIDQAAPWAHPILRSWIVKEVQERNKSFRQIAQEQGVTWKQIRDCYYGKRGW